MKALFTLKMSKNCWRPSHWRAYSAPPGPLAGVVGKQNGKRDSEETGKEKKKKKEGREKRDRKWGKSSRTILANISACPARNMKGTLSKYDRDVVPLRDNGISEVEQYGCAPRTLHSEAVVDAQSNFVPNRVLVTTPPELSSFECYLSRSVRTTLAQLRSGHCRLLNYYKARITAGVTDVCPNHTSWNICSSALPARRNWQLKTYGTIQTRWLIFSSSMTTNEGEELWATTTTTDRQTDRQVSTSPAVRHKGVNWSARSVYQT